MRTAIIGAGRMGRRHIEAVQELGWEVVGVADLSAETLATAKSERSLRDDVLFDDAERMQRATKPECVIVATTADSHCDLTCEAAEHGAKYVLVEKPMAVSLEQCDRMIATCERTGTRLAVNHQMRFMPQYVEAKRRLDDESYGGFVSMVFVAGNVGFARNGTHYLEAFRYMAGEPMTEVSAWFTEEVVPDPRGPRFADRGGTLRARTASGRRLIMEIGTDQGYGLSVAYTARYGLIYVDELIGYMRTAVREKEYREYPTTRVGMPAIREETTVDLPTVITTTANVLEALVSGVDNVSGEHGRHTIAALVAAHESAEQGGRSVRTDGPLDRSRLFPWA